MADMQATLTARLPGAPQLSVEVTAVKGAPTRSLYSCSAYSCARSTKAYFWCCSHVISGTSQICQSKSKWTKFNGAERWPRADDDAHDDGDVIGQTWWCHSSFGWRSCGDSFGAHKEQFVDFLHILTPCFDFSQFVRPMSILTNSYASFDS